MGATAVVTATNARPRWLGSQGGMAAELTRGTVHHVSHCAAAELRAAACVATRKGVAGLCVCDLCVYCDRARGAENKGALWLSRLPPTPSLASVTVTDRSRRRTLGQPI